MILREYAPLDREKVTAGLPSLSPQKRRDITDYHLKQLYQRACQQEYFRNEESAKTPDNGMDVTNPEQRIGIPLMGARIIGRLKKLNRNLWFEQSNADPSKMGCYVLKNDFKGGQTKEFIGGFETELNPETFISVLDEQGKVKKHIPGYWTLLAKLIRARLVTKSGVFALFGPPSRDSENWARFTQ